jgi:group I intron endonuclease
MHPVAIVYLVTNRVNGHTYVGVTRKSVETRWALHRYTAHSRPRTYLHRAIAKYGDDAFDVEPIASCLSSDAIGEVERTVIQSRRPTYNQTNGGEATRSRRISRETVARIAASNSGKKRTAAHKAAISAAKRAEWARQTPADRECVITKLRAARLLVDENKRRQAVAKAWKPLTMESRAKLSASCMGRRYGADTIARIAASKCKPVECIELKAAFDSVSEAAEACGVSITSVSRICLGQRRSANGLSFQFV